MPWVTLVKDSVRMRFACFVQYALVQNLVLLLNKRRSLLLPKMLTYSKTSVKSAFVMSCKNPYVSQGPWKHCYT